MKNLTDEQLYRLFVSTDDWRDSSDAVAIYRGILQKAKTDENLAAKIAVIDAELAAQNSGWVTLLLEAEPGSSSSFQDCL